MSEQSVDQFGDGAKALAEPVVFCAGDSFPLRGDLFSGDGDGPAALVSAATGAPRTFYNSFAAWLVNSGASHALTYDYRGMPGSPKPSDWQTRINLKDWALQDFPAAVKYLTSRANGKPLVGIGQSFGGQALGLSGVANEFDRYAFVATTSGYFGNLSRPIRSFVMMNFVGVPITRLLGRTAKWMGLGPGIPASVFSDWARWCRMRDYFFDDVHLPQTSRFSQVDLPILSIGMKDDEIGTPRAIAEFIKHYDNAVISEHWFGPEDNEGRAIGHLGFFRSHNKNTLWPMAAEWLLEGRLPAG